MTRTNQTLTFIFQFMTWGISPSFNIWEIEGECLEIQEVKMFVAF